MKKIDWRLGLLAAAAALSLQACDVQVHSDAANTTVQSPQASLPEDTKLNEPQTASVTPAADTTTNVATAPAPDAAASAAMPATDATATTAQAPLQPDTSALGAAPESPAAASTATTSAAPTELQRFFESNSPAAKADKAAAKK